MASDEELDDDGEIFGDCDQCPVAAAIDGLDPVNRVAWQLYRRVVTRFTVDSQSVGFVLQRMTADLDVDDFTEMMERFNILYDALNPPREDAGS